MKKTYRTDEWTVETLKQRRQVLERVLGGSSAFAAAIMLGRHPHPQPIEAAPGESDRSRSRNLPD